MAVPEGNPSLLPLLFSFVVAISLYRDQGVVFRSSEATCLGTRYEQVIRGAPINENLLRLWIGLPPRSLIQTLTEVYANKVKKVLACSSGSQERATNLHLAARLFLISISTLFLPLRNVVYIKGVGSQENPSTGGYHRAHRKGPCECCGILSPDVDTPMLQYLKNFIPLNRSITILQEK